MMGSRPVPAPENKDWLSETEVLALLGEISSRTLERYIAAGQFPRPILWGSTAKWRWEDVAWFHLGKLLSPRLGDDGQPDATEPPPARQRADKGSTTGRQPPPPD